MKYTHIDKTRPLHAPVWIALLALCALALVSCFGGGGGGNSHADEPPPVIRTTAVTSLEGAASAKAVDATLDLAANPGVPSTSIETDASGARIARTELEVWFTDSATVGEINALLAAHNASVVGMLKGVPFVVIHIPDPGSLAALDAIVSQLEASPIVEEVVRSPIPATNALPDNHTDVSGDVSWRNITAIDHHLAIGAHGAWNVKKALERPGVSPPTLLIADAFGNGAPLADYDVTPGIGDYGNTSPETHGYGVLSMISADFGGGDDDRGWVTGLYPGRLTLDVLDIKKTWGDATFESGWAAMEMDLLARVMNRWGGNVVANVSLGSPCDTPEGADIYCTPAYARGAAVRWIRKVRGRGLEGRFLMTAAAGNIYSAVPGHYDARYVNAFTAAALIHDLALVDGTPLAPLANTLVVENVVNEQNVVPFRPSCLAAGSKWPGNISAIGSYLSVLTDPALGFHHDAHGTSFAAPQVAGLAAYAWALAPGLSNFQVIDLLKNTAQDIAVESSADPECTALQPAPIIDAFTALLGLDSPTRLAGGVSTPVRLALLDVNDDRVFDEDDISEILDIYDNEPEVRDFGRYDLNGDGYTGGAGTARFDLNINAAFDTASYTYSGERVEVDEQEVMDHDVLCYYAHSDLYGGLSDERDDLLEGRCRFGELKIILGSENVTRHALMTRSEISSGGEQEDRQPAGGLPPISVGPDCEVAGGEEVNAGENRQFQSGLNHVFQWNSNSLNADMEVSVHSSGSSARLSYNFAGSASADVWGGPWRATARTAPEADYPIINLLVNNNTARPINLEVSWSLNAGASITDNSFNCEGQKDAYAQMLVYTVANYALNAPEYCNASWSLVPAQGNFVNASVGGYSILDATGNATDSAADTAVASIEPGKHLVTVIVRGIAESSMSLCGNVSAEASASAMVDISLRRQ